MSFSNNWAPYLGMIVVTVAYAGSNILCKLALQSGLSFLVLVVYRHLIALVILAPVAYVVERKQRPSLTLPILGKIFALALLGITVHQNVYYAGLDYTSPTVATALSNIIPALTFILAVSLRIERFDIRSSKGKAKIGGTMICIGGTLVFTLWKGYLFKGIVSEPLVVSVVHGHDHHDWLKGTFLILGSFVAFCAWLILQILVYNVYPAKLSMNAWLCLFASLQSSVLALIVARKSALWRLQWNVQLLTIIYCGTIISCISYYLQTFCISKKGPLFAAMFSPLLLVVVAIFSAFIFAERIHLGSLVGALMIILGLYCVLWGKSRDPAGNNCKLEKQMMESASCPEQKHVSSQTKDCPPA